MNDQSPAIKMAYSRNAFVTGLDGRLVYWPSGSDRSPSLDSDTLREFADELDKLNRERDLAFSQCFVETIKKELE